MIEIKEVFNKEITAYSSVVKFIYEGNEYVLLLSWDMYEGFTDKYWTMNGKDIPRPKWVENYKSVELDDDENKDSVYAFCYDLDALTNHDINEINAMNGIQ